MRLLLKRHATWTLGPVQTEPALPHASPFLQSFDFNVEMQGGRLRFTLPDGAEFSICKDPAHVALVVSNWVCACGGLGPCACLRGG